MSSLLFSSPLLRVSSHNSVRYRSTKGSYRIRNERKRLKQQHLLNRDARTAREKAHQERMVLQKKEAIERRVQNASRTEAELAAAAERREAKKAAHEARIAALREKKKDQEM